MTQATVPKLLVTKSRELRTSSSWIQMGVAGIAKIQHRADPPQGHHVEKYVDLQSACMGQSDFYHVLVSLDGTFRVVQVATRPISVHFMCATTQATRVALALSTHRRRGGYSP